MSSAPDCLQIFSDAPEDKTRADHIDRCAPNRACQNQVVSPHCGDSVDDAEVLVRLVIDDQHVKREDGALLLKSAFMNDSCSFGSSSLRLGRATKEEFQITLDEMINDKTPPKADGTPRELIGYVKIPVSLVRTARISQETKDPQGKTITFSVDGFGVYATGVDRRPNHADIFAVASCKDGAFSKSARNRAASKLTEMIASNFVETSSEAELIALGSS